MDRRGVNLRPDEVESALEELFGFSDGARSEDEAEDSDMEDLSGMLSSNNYDPINTTIFPELSPRPTSSPQPGPSNENVMQPPPPRSSRHSPSHIELELQEDFDPSEIENSDGSDADEDEWKKVAWSQNPVVSLFDSIQLQPVRNIANRTRPLVFFEMFFDSEAIDMIVTQSNLYASQCNDQNWEQTRNHTVLFQKEFRLTLSRELVANATFQKRPFATMPKFASKKSKSVQSEESESRQKKLFGVPREIRFSELGAHWPVELPTYRRCRLCSSAHNNQRSRIQCDRCQVPLCAVPCFKNYHQTDT
ncbi:unnamed protein product, partial [Brenthis ino]